MYDPSSYDRAQTLKIMFDAVNKERMPPVDEKQLLDKISELEITVEMLRSESDSLYDSVKELEEHRDQLEQVIVELSECFAKPDPRQAFIEQIIEERKNNPRL